MKIIPDKIILENEKSYLVNFKNLNFFRFLAIICHIQNYIIAISNSKKTIIITITIVIVIVIIIVFVFPQIIVI